MKLNLSKEDKKILNNIYKDSAIGILQEKRIYYSNNKQDFKDLMKKRRIK